MRILATTIAQLLGVAQAATITVGSLGDDGSGCTLRDAVASANQDAAIGGCAPGSGADTIRFSVTGSIQLGPPGEILVSSDVTVEGPGAGALTIAPAPSARVFRIENLYADPEVTVSSVTLSAGTLAGDDGGAIFATETLTLASTTISGGNADAGGAVYVDGFGLTGNVLTVSESVLSGNTAVRYGGAIAASRADVRIIDSTFMSNRAGPTGTPTSAYGGAIDVYAGALTIDSSSLGSTFDGNRVYGGNGGALAASGDVSISGATLSDNSAGGGGGVWVSGGGGAVKSVGGSGAGSTSEAPFEVRHRRGPAIINGAFALSVDVVRSTVSTNVAGDGGGGLAVEGVALTIDRSTLSGNDARIGAGIDASDTALSIVNSTLSGNSATEEGGGISARDGSGAGFLSVRSSTLALNSAGVDGSAIAADALMVDTTNGVLAGPSPMDPASLCRLTSGAGVNAVASWFFPGTSCTGTTFGDPMLDPLAANGGPTLTHRPAMGSGLRDAGDNGACASLGSDQRGRPRIADGDGDPGGVCDIGAFEAQSVPVSLLEFQID